MSAGSYLEDRSLIFDRLERLEQESKASMEFGVEQKLRLGKFNLDLNEAHKRIRGLISDKDTLGKQMIEWRVRAGYIAAGAGATVGLVTTLVIEGVRWLLHH